MKGIIFDMDGVLLDSMPVWEKLADRYLEVNGIECEESINPYVATKTMRGGVVYIKEKFGIKKTVDEMVQETIDLIGESYENEIPAKEGVLSFLDELKSMGMKVAVATASDIVLVESAFKRLGMLDKIDAIATCIEVKIGKEESPAVYEKALEKIGLSKQDVYVFEDSIQGIKTAKTAGFKTVGVYDDTAKHEQETIKNTVDFYLGEISDYRRFMEFAGGDK